MARPAASSTSAAKAGEGHDASSDDLVAEIDELHDNLMAILASSTMAISNPALVLQRVLGFSPSDHTDILATLQESGHSYDSMISAYVHNTKVMLHDQAHTTLGIRDHVKSSLVLKLRNLVRDLQAENPDAREAIPSASHSSAPESGSSGGLYAAAVPNSSTGGGSSQTAAKNGRAAGGRRGWVHAGGEDAVLAGKADPPRDMHGKAARPSRRQGSGARQHPSQQEKGGHSRSDSSMERRRRPADGHDTDAPRAQSARARDWHAGGGGGGGGGSNPRGRRRAERISPGRSQQSRSEPTVRRSAQSCIRHVVSCGNVASSEQPAAERRHSASSGVAPRPSCGCTALQQRLGWSSAAEAGRALLDGGGATAAPSFGRSAAPGLLAPQGTHPVVPALLGGGQAFSTAPGFAPAPAGSGSSNHLQQLPCLPGKPHLVLPHLVKQPQPAQLDTHFTALPQAQLQLQPPHGEADQLMRMGSASSCHLRGSAAADATPVTPHVRRVTSAPVPAQLAANHWPTGQAPPSSIVPARLPPGSSTAAALGEAAALADSSAFRLPARSEELHALPAPAGAEGAAAAPAMQHPCDPMRARAAESGLHLQTSDAAPASHSAAAPGATLPASIRWPLNHGYSLFSSRPLVQLTEPAATPLQW